MINSHDQLLTALDEAHKNCLLELNNELAETSGTLYHYTSLQGAVSMIENGKFWFTDIRYCNDPNEIEEGLRLLNEVHAEVMPQYLEKSPIFTAMMTYLVHLLTISMSFDTQDNLRLENAKSDLKKCGLNPEVFKLLKTSFFIACFSERHDDLRQWMPYADDGKGVSFCFEGLNKAHALTTKEIGILKVCYQSNENKKKYIKNMYIKASEIFDRTPNKQEMHMAFLGSLYMSMTYDLIACKSENYKDEKEWRLILFDERQAMDAKIKFRVSNNVVRPFVEVEINKDSVLGLILGPKTEPTLNQHAFEALLRKHSYLNAKVERSVVAYR